MVFDSPILSLFGFYQFCNEDVNNIFRGTLQTLTKYISVFNPRNSKRYNYYMALLNANVYPWALHYKTLNTNLDKIINNIQPQKDALVSIKKRINQIRILKYFKYGLILTFMKHCRWLKVPTLSRIRLLR